MAFTFEVLKKTRAYLKNVCVDTSLDDLNKIPDGFNNNIIWNIGHLVVTEQLLAYKLSGLPMMVSNDLIEKYQKGTKPEAHASQQEVDKIKQLLFATVTKTEDDYKNKTFKNFKAYTVSTTGNTLHTIEDALQFVLFHEGIHVGYIMALLRVVENQK